MSEDQYKFDRTSSDRAGVTMSASIEGNAIGDLLHSGDVPQRFAQPCSALGDEMRPEGLIGAGSHPW